MFPGVFEWVWDSGHIIFFGIVWLVLAALVSGIVYLLGKTVADTGRYMAEEKVPSIHLKSPVSALPPE